MRFEIDGRKLYPLLDEMEDRGEPLAAIYHSHTRSEPYPSQTDINFAVNWPDMEWIIVGLSKTADPVVRSYLIEEGEVREVEIR
jgi:[CysO sulfur-carrier protein]-S-L-cysteine hydrolase